MPRRSFDPTVRPPTQPRANRLHLVKEDDWIKAFLHQAQVATISTSWGDIPFNNMTLFWYDEPHHRIIFHANIMGRLRANIDNNPQVCLSCYEMGSLLPSNAAIEFSVQYRGVVVFGEAEILTDPQEARQVLYGLISKYFPKMQPGQEYRPITDTELRRTSVIAIKITEWSGRENWKDQTDQIDAWPALSEDMLKGGFA
jgi:nitroimidazol reductase NimA-like FMN-containing flavoprotein (pyridoxamine 5'-phosphate oxidase superfamily)